MTLYISVKRAVLVNNFRNKTTDPPYEIRTSKAQLDPQRVSDLTYTGTIRLKYDPANPLVSGAVAWIEIDEAPLAG
jgi:hypothetical protein